MDIDKVIISIEATLELLGSKSNDKTTNIAIGELNYLLYYLKKEKETKNLNKIKAWNKMPLQIEFIDNKLIIKPID
jgi:hypothetical protein